MNNLCILQARMGSTRLPGKVLMEINWIPMLKYEIERIKKAKNVDKIVIATSSNEKDNLIESFCLKNWIECFRWNQDDVLDRYYQCSLKYAQFEHIIRITWDCPLIDPQIIDEVINLFLNSWVDYCSNVEPETFPDWIDIEIFKANILQIAAKKAMLPSEREHVTPYIRKHFKKINFALETENYSSYRLTVDEKEDFELVKILIDKLWSDKSYRDYIKYIDNLSLNLNNHIIRNEWYNKSLIEDFLKVNKQ